MRSRSWCMIVVASAATIRMAIGCGGSNADSPSAETLDGAADDAPSTDPGADGDTEADAGPLPSFCSGLVLYASLDSTYRAERGGGDPLPYGNAKLSAQGRFGGAIELASDASDMDASAALYFVQPDGGPPVFPADEGTVALWVRANIDEDGSPVYYRPVANIPPDPLVPAGLSLVAFGSQFGLAHTPPGVATVPIHAFSRAAVRPYLRANEFNQFVTAWRRGDASGPTAYLAINGGTGERFVDAGPDASDPYADAQPTDSGALRVPYRGYSSARWNYDASPTAMRLGAPTQGSVTQGLIDDVAVWNRILTFEEIEATYRAGVSIGQACRLR